MTYEQDNCRANTPTDRQEFVPIRLRIRPRCWHYTATRTTPSLVPYYYLNLTTVAPIRLRSNDQSIDELYVQPLSPPDARTVLLPESDNCCADTPAIPIMVVLISLQPIKEELPEDRQDSVPICLRNRPCASTVLPHTIDKLIAPLCLLLRQMIVPVRLRLTD